MSLTFADHVMKYRKVLFTTYALPVINWHFVKQGKFYYLTLGKEYIYQANFISMKINKHRYNE